MKKKPPTLPEPQQGFVYIKTDHETPLSYFVDEIRMEKSKSGDGLVRLHCYMRDSDPGRPGDYYASVFRRCLTITMRDGCMDHIVAVWPVVKEAVQPKEEKKK